MRLALAAALVLLLLPALGWAQASGVTARIDRDRIGLRDTVTLEVRVEMQGRLRFGLPAGQDFEVLSQATSTSQRFDHTGAYSVTTRILRMRPLRTGTLTIGPVPIETPRGVVQTEAFTVEVLDQAPATPPPPTAVGAPQPPRPLPGTSPQPQAPADPRSIPAAPSTRSDAWAWGTITDARPGEPFLAARVSRTDPVVGEQFFVEYLLCSPLTAFGMSLVGADQPEFTGVWFRDVTEQRVDRRSLGTQRINNEMYEVNVLNSFVVVPLREGELIIPPFSVDLSIDSILQARRIATFQSQPLALQVTLPPSDGRPSGFREGNVGRFELDLELDRETLRVGDALTVTLRVRGAALMSRITLPEFPEITNARLLNSSDRSSEEYGRSGWLEGFATRTVSLLANAEGELVIPPIHFAYWDPFASQYRTLQTEPRQVQVAGTVPTATPTAAGAETAPDHWSDTLPAARVVTNAAPATSIVFWRSPLYPVALLLPPLLFAASTLGRRAVANTRKRRAGRRTADIAAAVIRDLEAIGPADTDAMATLVALLHEYLSTRLGRPTRGLTRPALRAAVRSSIGAAAEQVVDTIEAAERARYGGAADAASVLRQAVDAIRSSEGDAA